MSNGEAPEGQEERDGELRALRGMIDATSASLAYVDRDLRLVTGNRRCRESLGLPAETAALRKLSDLLPRDLYEQSLPFLRRCLEGEEQLYRALSPDGRTEQRVHIVPARGADGRVEGLVEARTTLETDDGLEGRREDRELDLALKVAEYRRLATTDLLSGALNRATILEVLEEEIRRAERYGRPLSLAMFDLDRFKLVNDIHGRAAGDEAIRRLSSICHSTFRNTDCFGRYGGEEFLAILPEVAWEGASVAAERVRSGMQAERFRATSLGAAKRAETAPGGFPPPDEFTVTVSAGVAAFERGIDADGLLARADAALSRAKEKGRNRVEIHGRH